MMNQRIPVIILTGPCKDGKNRIIQELNNKYNFLHIISNHSDEAYPFPENWEGDYLPEDHILYELTVSSLPVNALIIDVPTTVSATEVAYYLLTDHLLQPYYDIQDIVYVSEASDFEDSIDAYALSQDLPWCSKVYLTEMEHLTPLEQDVLQMTIEELAPAASLITNYSTLTNKSVFSTTTALQVLNTATPQIIGNMQALEKNLKGVSLKQFTDWAEGALMTKGVNRLWAVIEEEEHNYLLTNIKSQLIINKLQKNTIVPRAMIIGQNISLDFNFEKTAMPKELLTLVNTKLEEAAAKALLK
ncbi:hypothetical protein [Algivirga pacifica]|uniref:Uncharacterized protein n=1 Tax=Algivirga pacifica TaxID=1162670 RepID=A0ABP9D276_9BACT